MRPAAAAAPPLVYPAQAAPDSAAEEAGRRLFAGACGFIAGAAAAAAFPAEGLPELAFAGRSNVGKSSLINALAGRRALARVSRTPGRTQQVNFFDLAGRLMIVDLPGYGFARTSKREVERWSDLIARYLRSRASLRRVLLLIDARHGLKPEDRPMLDLLDGAAVSFQAVLTKTDAADPTELPARLAALAAELGRHGAGHPAIHLTSARDGGGIAALRGALAALAAPQPPR